MNLLQIRKLFRDISGRYDLVNEDFTDNGCDVYINEGSRWLDRQIKVTKETGSYLYLASANEWSVQYPLCRGLKEVWLYSVDGSIQLTKISLRELLLNFYRDIPANWEASVPYCYAPISARYLPADLTAETLATIASLTGIITSSGEEYDAIILSCPLDRQAAVEIKGNFYSAALVEQDDTNFWSSVHPMLLTQSAIRQTYVASGNKHMLDMSEAAMSKDIAAIGMDLVEQEIAGVDRMSDYDQRRD